MNENQSLKNRKIVLVEDDPFFYNVLSTRFAQEETHLIYAGVGADALKVIHDEHPDVIILDILLPGMDGIEILRTLKADAATREIPVIMFSNVNDQEKIDATKNLGAASFFHKGMVTPLEVIGYVRTALDHGTPTPHA